MEWDRKKTAETRKLEETFRGEFPGTEAYRFNSASIRVRVIDERFEGMPIADREALVWPLLEKLPKKTREDILVLLTLAPSEQVPKNTSSQILMNYEFEHPMDSRL